MHLLRKLFLRLSIALIFVGGCSNSAPSGPTVVTKAEADQIRVGMTLEEAQKIIGTPGEAMPVPEGSEQIVAAAPSPHMWTNPDGSGLMVSVMRGKIDQVSPMNLK